MKATKFVLAMASILMLASCGNGAATSSASAEASTSSAPAKKTMGFIDDGKYYAVIPNDVIEPVGDVAPKIRINGTAIAGSRSDTIGSNFTITAEGSFAKPFYITLVTSSGEGSISARVYGGLENDKVSEGLALVASVAKGANKVFIDFTTTKKSWTKGLDEEMDKEINVAWDLIG